MQPPRRMEEETPWLWMSGRVFERLNGRKSANAFLVYGALALHANKAGTCLVSWERVEEITKLTRDGIKRGLRELRAKGMIQTTHRYGRHDGAQLPSLFTLLRLADTQSAATQITHTRVENEYGGRGASAPGGGAPVPLRTVRSDLTNTDLPSIGKRSEFPKDFSLTPERKAYTEGKGIDPDTEWEQFANYHQAKGSVMRDWDAAWRTWVGNAVRFSQRAHKAKSSAPSPNNRIPCPDYVPPDWEEISKRFGQIASLTWQKFLPYNAERLCTAEQWRERWRQACVKDLNASGRLLTGVNFFPDERKRKYV